jgi:6-pyruvoyltetrahydropterin/6-carboxytetrahydropterin synthase
LHRHNYQLRVDISVPQLNPDLGMAFDFNDVKPMIRRLCDELDERILIPAKSPYVKIKISGKQTEVKFADKEYVFPTEDTASLPLSNISSEELARHLCDLLVAEMKDLKHWTEIQVNVEETRGQSVSYRRPR